MENNMKDNTKDNMTGKMKDNTKGTPKGKSKGTPKGKSKGTPKGKSKGTPKGKPLGRPPTKITWPNTGFTIQDAMGHTAAKDGTRICKLQMRNRIRRAIADGILVKLEETRKDTTGAGRPQFLYARRTVLEAWKNQRGQRGQKGQKGQKRAETTTVASADPSPVQTPTPAANEVAPVVAA